MWAAALGGAVNIGGGIAGAIVSARQAAKQRDFNKWMFQHRYRMQMKDMRAAGLNPILAYGSSPPTVTGAAASVGPLAQGAVSSARDAASFRRDLAQKDRNIELTEAQAGLTKVQEANTLNQAEANAWRVEEAEAAAERMRHLANSAQSAARIDRRIASVKDTPEYEKKLIADMAIETATDARDLVNPFNWLWSRGPRVKPGTGPLRPRRPGR